MRKFVFLLLIIINYSSFAQLKLPRLISDGMVLQRETPLRIWGWANPKDTILAEFINQRFKAIVKDDGKWEIIIPPQKSGGPYDLTIVSNETVIIKDILIGDVWVCSGQSNMELPMRRVSWIYEDEIKNANYPNIRYFTIPKKYNFLHPEKDVSQGKWTICNPQNVMHFSAVAFFYAVELWNKYKVPIGIIDATLGGSPAEAWISEEALKKFPRHYNEMLKFKDTTLIRNIEKNDQELIDNWHNTAFKQDKLNIHRVHDSSIQWKTVVLPNYWKNTSIKDTSGIIWLKKTFTLSQKPDTTSLLLLGRIIDSDSVFINGVFVGSTGYQYPPRRYIIPARGVLKEGTNIIAVKVINYSKGGGFVPDKPYRLEIGKQKIDLSGKWQFFVSAYMPTGPSRTFIQWKPGGLYNGMIAPITSYSIKGIIWYQGESNISRANEYFSIMSTLISDWRHRFKNPHMPFLYVQLANYHEPDVNPSESDWALLREAQTKLLSIANTAMALAIDLGEWNDIHPLNKKDVGKRLALAAYNIAYNENNIVFSGPLYKSMQIDGNKIIITFDHVGSGLIVKGGKHLKQFAIAGNDKKFVWANARIENNKVIVWHKSIKNPVAVRYAWANNPANANLYNKEGLPAVPFRTDCDY